MWLHGFAGGRLLFAPAGCPSAQPFGFGASSTVLQAFKTFAAMGAAVCLMTRILPFSRLLTIVEVAVGIAVFVVTAIWTKALTKEDLNAFRRKRK